MNSPKDYLAEHLARSAQREAAQLGSALPADPTLTPDAQALRAKYATPMERLNGFANGIFEYHDPAAMRADIALLSYFHKQQTNAVRIETDADARMAEWRAALRSIKDRTERAEFRAAYEAALAVRKAQDASSIALSSSAGEPVSGSSHEPSA